MTTIETLSALQKRVRETTGPDRELDVAIAYAFYPNQLWCAEHPFAPEDVAPNYTTDPDGLGVCVALQRAALPGWGWGKFLDGAFEIAGPPETRTTYARPLANDCLTFIDAIVSAVIAEEEAKERVG